MFLLFLGLGAASVNAQVRIGGNAAPNAAAALDLNATDATNNGTKGLALPRVNLTSNTMQLTTGVVNLTGMLVYNTTATLGRIGIYYWNGANWILASLPSTSAADSGLFLMSNGTSVVFSTPIANHYQDTVKVTARLKADTVHFSLVLDTTVTVTFKRNLVTWVSRQNIFNTDLCQYKSDVQIINAGQNGISFFLWYADKGTLPTSPVGVRIRCYRPSI